MADSSGSPPRRVLVVDDDPTVLVALERLLTTVGLASEGATRPLDALDRVVRAPDEYLALISDMDLPEMTGHELIVRLQRASITLPSILMSGRDDWPVPITLHKPFSYAQLHAALAALGLDLDPLSRP